MKKLLSIFFISCLLFSCVKTENKTEELTGVNWNRWNYEIKIDYIVNHAILIDGFEITYQNCQNILDKMDIFYSIEENKNKELSDTLFKILEN